MGKLTACEEKVSNRFKFNGQQYDPISQQYYLRARHYNPVIGRFTQEDTYRGDGLNLYAYCANNPVYFIDPSGNVFCEKAINRIMNEHEKGNADIHEIRKLKEQILMKHKKCQSLNDAEIKAIEYFKIDVGNEPVRYGCPYSQLEKNRKKF